MEEKHFHGKWKRMKKLLGIWIDFFYRKKQKKSSFFTNELHFKGAMEFPFF